MFKFNQLDKIQIEITNRCQASCPMCPRNIHGGISNPLLKLNDWTLLDFSKIFTVEVLTQLRFINFCGDFGDPILNNELIPMCQYLAKTKPNIQVQIHTNGSARNENWWQELATSLPVNHSVVFALDGLADTHAVYRIGTDYNKVIDNARAFIQAGGNAEWCFIRFKHNAHQVKQAQQLSVDLGFKNFILKNSKRFSRPFPVVDKLGQLLYNIEQPEDTPIEFVGKSQVAGHQQWRNADKINCQSLNDKELYIDAHYLLSPCCMVGAFLYTNYDSNLLKEYNLYEEDSVLEEGALVQAQVLAFPKLNVLEVGLKQIVETDMWQTMWQKKWNEKSSSTCIIMCGPNSPYISTDEQKITEHVR
jgi:hypothetical protein